MFGRRSALGVLITGLLLTALPMGAFAQPAVPALEGTDWRLTQMAGSGVPFIDVPAGVDATLRIDGTDASGSGGCNQWFASVTVDGASIAFGQVGSTMMACPEPAMSIESFWLGYLPQVASWSITGGRLELADPNGAVLLVFAQPAVSALEGTDWQLTQVWSQGVLTPVPAGVTATLTLTGGQASGSGGCAQLFGSYTLSGHALALAGLMNGAMLCPEPQMSVQEAYLAALGTVAAWQTDGATLQLLDASGQVVATFTPAPATSPSLAVSLGLYSGRPDPSWTLTDAQSAELTRLLGSLPSAFGDPAEGGLGYHGFYIVPGEAGRADRTLVAYRGAVADLGSGSRPYRLDAKRTVERYLLETGRPYLSATEVEAVETDLRTP